MNNRPLTRERQRLQREKMRKLRMDMCTVAACPPIQYVNPYEAFFANYNGPAKAADKIPIKKGTPMNNFANIVAFEETAPTDQVQRANLLSHLDSANREFHPKARKHFGLTQDEAPKTAKELVERIKAGKITLPKEDNDRKCSYVWDVFSRIKWQDPSVVEDQDGYDAWEEKTAVAKRTVERIISIKSPDEGLNAVIEFEKTTIA